MVSGVWIVFSQRSFSTAGSILTSITAAALTIFSVCALYLLYLLVSGVLHDTINCPESYTSALFCRVADLLQIYVFDE
jgi:hypothetical protein